MSLTISVQQMKNFSINVENRELTTEPRPGHKTVTHLKRYPLVLETRDTLESIAASRVVLANTIPLVRSVVNSKPVKAVQPVTNVVDDIMASGLDLTEAMSSPHLRQRLSVF